MKPHHARLLACLLVVAAGVGCQRTQPAEAAPATSRAPAADPWGAAPAKSVDPLPHPLCWSAEKDGHTTYFFGTMHVGVDPARVPAWVLARLDASPTFAMETDLGDASLGDMQRKDGGSLHGDLGDAYWQKLQAALPRGVAGRVDRMKPMVAATMLSLRGLPETAPMDGALLGHAREHGKHILYLEPASKEEALLEKWMNTTALRDMLDDLSWGEEHTKEMVDAYLAGDDHKILSLSDDERAEWLKEGHPAAQYDQQMQDLLYGRNASWIPELKKMHAAGGGFVAVGAMHLIGPHSVLDLLAKDGFRITRLSK